MSSNSDVTGGLKPPTQGAVGKGGKFLLVHPRDEESYWQPQPANGYASVHVAPHLVPMDRPFSAGTQTVPPGGFVRLHSHTDNEEVLHFIAGHGKAILDGVEYRLEPGMHVKILHGKAAQEANMQSAVQQALP